MGFCYSFLMAVYMHGIKQFPLVPWSSVNHVSRTSLLVHIKVVSRVVSGGELDGMDLLCVAVFVARM